MKGITSLMIQKKKVIPKIPIDEIPFMINEQNEVVCIPRSPDQPIIAVVGKRSSGKSYSAHGLIDRIYWYWKENVAVLNDSLNECQTWCQPNYFKNDVKRMDFLKETPKPLPCVYVYPDHIGFREPEHDYVQMSLPFQFFLENINLFLDIGHQSATYTSILKIKDKLVSCKSPQEVEEVIASIRNKSVRGATERALYRVIAERITDFNSKAPSVLDVSHLYQYRDICSEDELSEELKEYPLNKRQYNVIEWTREQKADEFWQEFLAKQGYAGKKMMWRFRSRYMPIIAYMRQGLIPILNTEQLLGKPYFHEYMYYILNIIFMNQEADPYFKKQEIPIWLFIDEITRLSSTDLRKMTSTAVKTIAQSGRPARIGMVYITQNYRKADTTLRSQTSYLFSLRLKSKDDANAIRDDMDLANHERDELLRLEKHQMLAMTTEHFVIYTSDGARYSTDEPQLGKSLPTLSLHKPPRKMK